MTVSQFFAAFDAGQRHFTALDFEYEEGFSGKDFSGVIFENCFLYLDFRNSNLYDAQFIGCNIKEIDLRGANLTGAFMTRCLVESAMFRGACTAGFRFVENYCYGVVLNQTDFDEKLAYSGEEHENPK